MKSIRWVFLAGVAALSLAGAVRADDVLGSNPPLTDAQSGTINDAVHGLAGLKAVTERGQSSWQKSADWDKYQDWIDGRWSYIERVRLGAMRAWAGGALGNLRGRSSTVYYPFSGPDFLYVNTFFPDAKYLVMAGLEPVGTLPDLTTLQQQGKLGAYLADVKTSLFTILAASFFKTKDMKNDLNNQLVDGLLPDLAVFLGHQGYSIESISYVSLARDGTLHPHGASGATGVQIGYRKGGGTQYLLYFQADLGNDGLKSNPGYVRLMERLKPGVTYLKAASYLLYLDYFSTMRNAILDNSTGVVEDDSGIPLRNFPPAKWNVAAYGNYTGPLAIFKDSYQPDLVKFYASNPHPALPFGSGYKYIASNSSLLIATKK